MPVTGRNLPPSGLYGGLRNDQHLKGIFCGYDLVRPFFSESRSHNSSITLSLGFSLTNHRHNWAKSLKRYAPLQYAEVLVETGRDIYPGLIRQRGCTKIFRLYSPTVCSLG